LQLIIVLAQTQDIPLGNVQKGTYNKHTYVCIYYLFQSSIHSSYWTGIFPINKSAISLSALALINIPRIQIG